MFPPKPSMPKSPAMQMKTKAERTALVRQALSRHMKHPDTSQEKAEGGAKDEVGDVKGRAC
jgi:hypothetical protein